MLHRSINWGRPGGSVAQSDCRVACPKIRDGGAPSVHRSDSGEGSGLDRRSGAPSVPREHAAIPAAHGERRPNLGGSSNTSAPRPDTRAARDSRLLDGARCAAGADRGNKRGSQRPGRPAAVCCRRSLTRPSSRGSSRRRRRARAASPHANRRWRVVSSWWFPRVEGPKWAPIRGRPSAAARIHRSKQRGLSIEQRKASRNRHANSPAASDKDRDGNRGRTSREQRREPAASAPTSKTQQRLRHRFPQPCGRRHAQGGATGSAECRLGNCATAPMSVASTWIAAPGVAGGKESQNGSRRQTFGEFTYPRQRRSTSPPLRTPPPERATLAARHPRAAARRARCGRWRGVQPTVQRAAMRARQLRSASSWTGLISQRSNPASFILS